MPEMERYGVRPTVYEGPGSFTSYLLTRAPSVTSSAARVAAARTPGSVAAPGVPLAVPFGFIAPYLN